eukprot:CAMPEP_0206574778 /NCGR_PEP_ID=MMETSP0325_2-20121206/29665_1 /ASSEMBLY_ACC=CAM_ASM_000347 /TAXON_ID=2866 /ORGANISM="Crypthecodinium cohnii, Strain Seligo" /LENGTH=279 /DNA_ID=CAMNT_0054079481 /DNA_START=51 /DNA_END=888 /DNA_ORIENTATION=-
MADLQEASKNLHNHAHSLSNTYSNNNTNINTNTSNHSHSSSYLAAAVAAAALPLAHNKADSPHPPPTLATLVFSAPGHHPAVIVMAKFPASVRWPQLPRPAAMQLFSAAAAPTSGTSPSITCFGYEGLTELTRPKPSQQRRPMPPPAEAEMRSERERAAAKTLHVPHIPGASVVQSWQVPHRPAGGVPTPSQTPTPKQAAGTFRTARSPMGDDDDDDDDNDDPDVEEDSGSAERSFPRCDPQASQSHGGGGVDLGGSSEGDRSSGGRAADRGANNVEGG